MYEDNQPQFYTNSEGEFEEEESEHEFDRLENDSYLFKNNREIQALPEE